MKAGLLLAALMGTAAVSIAAVPAQSAQTQRDWSTVVAATPEGGYRMGNPDAPVKVVEFVSLTCGHCAHFAEEGLPPLVENYVKGGQVSFEYRNFFLNGFDLVAALVSRCAAPDDYFELSDAILERQEEWIGRIQNLTPEQRQEIGALSPQQGFARIAAISGLEEIAGRHGIGPAEMQACLADLSRAETLIQMKAAGERDHHVHGTPSFLVNGRLAEGVHDWAALEPLLNPET